MPSDPENKRQSTRLRVLKGAKIVPLATWSLTDCTVRDLSEKGAKLRCSDPVKVPDEFRLLLPAENTIQAAKVMWRKVDMVGVEFTGEKLRAPPRKY
jgi:PilZ domain